jgi:hypothetical protein
MDALQEQSLTNMILVLIMRSYPQIMVLGWASDRVMQKSLDPMDRIITFRGAFQSGSSVPSKSCCRSSLETQI